MCIEFQNVKKTYGDLLVLDQVSFRLEETAIHCLMGPSGSGKTTILNLLLGLERPDSGTILGTRGRRFSCVFQEDRLCEGFTALENVSMVTGKDLSKDRLESELSSLLPAESLHRPVSTLSGGMRRRTAICRALLAPFDVLAMDEPLAGLDPDNRQKVADYIRQKAAGKTVLMTTHQAEDVALFGGRVLRIGTAGGKR